MFIMAIFNFNVSGNLKATATAEEYSLITCAQTVSSYSKAGYAMTRSILQYFCTFMHSWCTRDIQYVLTFALQYLWSQHDFSYTSLSALLIGSMFSYYFAWDIHPMYTNFHFVYSQLYFLLFLAYLQNNVYWCIWSVNIIQFSYTCNCNIFGSDFCGFQFQQAAACPKSKNHHAFFKMAQRLSNLESTQIVCSW